MSYKTNTTFKIKKKIIIPIFTLIFTFIFLNFPSSTLYWFGFKRFPSRNNIIFATTIIPIVIEFILLLIAVESILIYIKKKKILIEKVSIIDALNQKDWNSLLFLFPITIFFEELFFRGFLFEFLNIFFSSFALIFANATIFSAYHFHIYLTSKNLKITIIYIILSFFLGIFLSNFLPYIGIIGVWAFHLMVILYFYIRLFYKNEINIKE